MIICRAAKLIALACLLGATGTGVVASRGSAQNQSPCGLQPSRKVDEYGKVSPADEKARLEKFYAVMESAGEDTQGFIVGYGGRVGMAGDALARVDRAKAYLAEAHVFYNKRLNAIDCGRREEEATELWLTPVGAAPPVCSPTVGAGEAQIKSRGRRPATSRPTSVRKSSGRGQ